MTTEFDISDAIMADAAANGMADPEAPMDDDGQGDALASDVGQADGEGSGPDDGDRGPEVPEITRNKELALAAMALIPKEEAPKEAPRQPEKPLLTASGTAPRPAGKFAALVEELEAEKVRFLLNGCPEIELPSIVGEVDLDDTEAEEAIQSLPADVRYVVEATAQIQNIDPVFSLSGFLQGATVCTGLRAGIITSADEEHRESGTLHILSIGHSSDGKGRGVSRYAEVIDGIVKEQNAAYREARKVWLPATTGELDAEEDKEKKSKGRKIVRLPHFRAYTTSPTEGAIIDIHTDNPHAGTALWIDEAGNALQELTKFTKGGGEESARNLLIFGFDAIRPYIRDRMRNNGEEGYTDVERFGMSFLGGLQTQYAAKFFNGNDGKSRGRGMAQRFLSFSGTEVPASTEEITIESLYRKKDKSNAIEIREYLKGKFSAMLDLDRVNEFYLLAHDLIKEGGDLDELNEMIKGGLRKDTIFFTLQPHALLELERFKQRMDNYKKGCKYSQDEKSSIAYDRMKIDKIVAILHYFKWADLPLRERHPSYYIANMGKHVQHVSIPRQYQNIDLKYGDIQNIPVTMDVVQAAIRIVLFSASCRRNLFDEVEDQSRDVRRDQFYEWAYEYDNLIRLCGEFREGKSKTLMLKEIMDLGYHGFADGKKPWGKGKVREFLKKSLGLENNKEPRGYAYNFRDLPRIAARIEWYLSGGPETPPDGSDAVDAVTENRTA